MTMKKIFLLAAFIFMAVTDIYAQEGRNQIYRIWLGSVQYTHRNEKMSTTDAISKVVAGVLTGKTDIQATKYEEDVKNAIIKGLSESHRYRFKNGLAQVDDNTGEGNLVVDVVITNIKAKSENSSLKDKDGKTVVNYRGEVEAMLTLKDAKTGEVVASPTFNGSGLGSSSYSDSDKAVRSAIGRLADRITNWLNKYRPITANIIEGSTAKKDKQKEVYIDLGSREGATEGLHMSVYVIKNIAGREAKSQIGKLRIEAVEGEDISRCKVTSGGKDIKAALDAGETLRAISVE